MGIKLQQPVHALGQVPARQRRAGDVADVAIQRDRIGRGLAGELPAPAGKAHFADETASWNRLTTAVQNVLSS